LIFNNDISEVESEYLFPGYGNTAFDTLGTGWCTLPCNTAFDQEWVKFSVPQICAHNFLWPSMRPSLQTYYHIYILYMPNPNLQFQINLKSNSAPV